METSPPAVDIATWCIYQSAYSTSTICVFMVTNSDTGYFVELLKSENLNIILMDTHTTRLGLRRSTGAACPPTRLYL